MADWTLKFVDRIDAAPTVRLDLNDQTNFRALADGCDFSPPELRRSQGGTMTSDGLPVDASAFGNRTVHLKLLVKANSSDSLATKLRSLMFELNRERNLIMLQRGSTPLFFRTYRSPDGTLDVGNDGMNQATVECSVMAEPTAYGLMQTLSGTVNNDPANATNPMSLVFSNTAVLGDVDTPAQIKWPTAGTALVSMRYSSTAAPSLLFAQAETGTAIIDAALAASNDAAMSGAGNNYLRSSFGSTALTDRWRVTVGTAGTALRGTYRVYLRWRKSVATDTNTFRLTLRDTVSGTVDVVGPVITENAPFTGPFWTDLGLFQIPMGEDPRIDGYSGTELSCSAVSARVGIGRTAGTGTVDSDALVFVPADTSMGFFSAAPTGTNVVADGPTDTFYTLNGANLSSQSSTRVGAIPSLRPGAHNQLVFFRSVGVNSGGDTGVTATTALTVNYWPRYLTV